MTDDLIPPTRLDWWATRVYDAVEYGRYTVDVGDRMPPRGSEEERAMWNHDHPDRDTLTAFIAEILTEAPAPREDVDRVVAAAAGAGLADLTEATTLQPLTAEEIAIIQLLRDDPKPKKAIALAEADRLRLRDWFLALDDQQGTSPEDAELAGRFGLT
jgi:hypothetical protein